MKTKLVVLSMLLMAACFTVDAQMRREDIHTDFVTYSKRKLLQKDLQENVIGKAVSFPVDSTTEFRFEYACRAITQFLVADEQSRTVCDKLFASYSTLEYDTRQALLEAIYAVYPATYQAEVNNILSSEQEPKLFAMAAVYLYRNDPSATFLNKINARLNSGFAGYDTIPVLAELKKYLSNYHQQVQQPTPSLSNLFNYAPQLKQKVIYSFQRWNRDYAGMAIVQNADGSFVRHPDGRLMVFEQLARSASDLPYFLTDGSTPQGVYRITGTAVSNNKLIGPTPNLQMIMPYESYWANYFYQPEDSVVDMLNPYLQLLPPTWRTYTPMREAYYAGKIGRTAIIAHGTTIDPEYFSNKPFYPLTPTMGCLCAKELWNVTNGNLLISEQWNLVSAFISSPGSKGYLYVINVDNQQKPVTRQEVEEWVKKK
ncbi:MAG: hypothetical protein QM731_13630 [Chitinophagaceae bacterium]